MKISKLLPILLISVTINTPFLSIMMILRLRVVKLDIKFTSPVSATLDCLGSNLELLFLCCLLNYKLHGRLTSLFRLRLKSEEDKMNFKLHVTRQMNTIA